MCSSKANLRYFLWCNLFWRFLRSTASVLPVQSSSATRTSACCGIRPNRTLGWLIFPQILLSGPILCMEAVRRCDASAGKSLIYTIVVSACFNVRTCWPSSKALSLGMSTDIEVLPFIVSLANHNPHQPHTCVADKSLATAASAIAAMQPNPHHTEVQPDRDISLLY